jgi:hypothetical protein
MRWPLLCFGSGAIQLHDFAPDQTKTDRFGTSLFDTPISRLVRTFASASRILLAILAVAHAIEPNQANETTLPVRVLLLSVDGMHAVDLERYTEKNPGSAFASLLQHGINYTSASAAKPADSFPGMMALATGGSPISTGVYFDSSYDRLCGRPA